MKAKLAFFTILIALITASIACQAAAPISNIFATPTPTVTVTPSPTITPSPTPSPTMTPSPTPVPTGVQFEQQPDKSTRIVDYDNGYAFVLSEDWLPVQADAQTIKDRSEVISKTDPELAEMLKGLDMLDNKAFRMVAFNKNDAYRDGQLVTNVFVLAYEDKISAALPLDFVVRVNTDQLKAMPTVKILSQGTTKNKNNIEYGYIEVTTTVKSIKGLVKAHQNLFIFKLDDRFIFLTLTLPNSLSKSGASLGQTLVDAMTFLKK